MSYRTRSQGLLVLAPTSRRTNFPLSCASQVWTSPVVTSSMYVGSIKSMTDEVVKGFQKKRAEGLTFFNNMFSSERSYEIKDPGTGYMIRDNVLACSPATYSFEQEDTSGLHRFCTQGAVVPGYQTIMISKLVDQAVIDGYVYELATKVASDRGRSQSNLWETLAEFDKTLDMFKHPLSRLTGILDDATKAKKAGRFQGYASNGMSNLYLAYRYGIRPVVSDVEAICQGLKKKVGKQRVTTRASKQISLTRSISGVGNLGIVQVNWINSILDTVNVRAMSLDEASLSVMENIGFSSKGLITLPWELVRYSFVSDWAANIGDFIGAIAPAFGWNQLGSCVSIKRDVINTYTALSTTLTNVNYVLLRPVTGVISARETTKSRGPLPAPSLVVKQSFQLDNVTRLADAWSLIAQRANMLFR